ncbi:MAG TPA: general secretion pathway protein GspK [Verrucomicrobiae bacterium]|jgi:general secretion pathway protein K|nr:general secretion pathway protein GspK [Verrucomicrobiae bacterium]
MIIQCSKAKKRSGIALIIVLVVIVVLAILAGRFAYSMNVEVTLARHAAFSSELDWMGRSGVEVAKWVLGQEAQGPMGRVDSLKAKWAGGPGETNSAVAGIDLKNYPLGKGTLSIEIKDLDRKFNINVAASDETVLRQALTLIGVDAGSFGTIVGSIQDWRDLDDNPHMGGTETETYEQQDPPYFCKNGPIDDLSELLLIRGITPAMYYGSAGGELPQIFNRPQGGQRGRSEEPSYAVGLVDLFTALSAGPINLNTASATVLQLMPDIDENIAQAIIQARAGPDGQDGTDDDMPFRSPQELAGRVPGFVNPAAIAQIGRFFGVQSVVFEVHVKASISSSTREYVAVLLRRSPKDVQTLNLYWK